MLCALVAATIAVAVPTPADAASGNLCDTDRFQRIYRADFSRRSDLNAWNKYNSPGHAGNGLRRPSAVTTRHGKLVITATNQGGQTVSGGVSNRNLSQRYGCYRFRVRTDRDWSNVTSGVIMTWPSSGGQHAGGENDVYETTHRQADRRTFMTFIHRPGDYSSNSRHQHWYRHQAPADRYQTMTMVWTPDQMIIHRAGPDQNGRYTTSSHVVPTANIPHVAHHPAIQLDARTSGQLARPVRLEVDWFEVYDYKG
ncbi:MAG: glycoside hydrolase family 16 protein [Actinomycetota bacterium]